MRAWRAERCRMNKLEKIIAAVEPHATSTAAARLGARLADAHGAVLELFTPVYNSRVSLAHFEDRDSLRHARELLVKRHEERLQSVSAGLDCAGKVSTHAAWDHPPEEALVRRVLDEDADLLIVELPPGGGSDAPALSSAQWQLVRHCPAPVLLTRGHAWKAAPRIVASLDPMGGHGRHAELDAAILRLAERIAERAGGTVHAFHAWHRSLHALIGDFTQPLAPELPESETERRHREAIEAVLEKTGSKPASLSLVEARPEDGLPEHCAQLGADLAVMGAIARNPFGRIFIGSTAERVLGQLPCDLLVVKPESFRTPVPRERWPHEDSPPPVIGVPGI